MSLYDKLYLEIAEKILQEGVLENNRTGTPAYKLPHQVMTFDLQQEFPILTTKRVQWKSAVKELLWIYKHQSNDLEILHQQGVHIWDEWAMEDNTIGTAYGYVVKATKQLDKVLHSLKHNPQDRRMIIDLWQVPYLDTGALHPCCFLTMWDVTDGFLNCMLVQRSGDFGLGIPFNTTQYAVLVHLLAQVTGHKPGRLTHVINNAHIYANHVDGIKLQLTRKNQTYPAPKLWIDPNLTNFYDVTPSHINLIDYKYHDSIFMEVSV